MTVLKQSLREPKISYLHNVTTLYLSFFPITLRDNTAPTTSHSAHGNLCYVLGWTHIADSQTELHGQGEHDKSR